MRFLVGLAVSAAIGCAVVACSDSTSPTAPTSDVVLRGDSAVYQLDTIGGFYGHPLYFANHGTAPVHLRFCNNAGFPAVDLKLYKQDGTTWLLTRYLTCGLPSDGYDQVVAPGQEIKVAQERSPPESGVFEYLLVYSREDGVEETVTSAPFTVE